MSTMIIIAISIMVAALLFAWACSEKAQRKVEEQTIKDLDRAYNDILLMRTDLQNRLDERLTHMQHAHRKIKRVQAENHTIRGLNRQLSEETVCTRIELAAVRVALVEAERDNDSLQKQLDVFSNICADLVRKTEMKRRKVRKSS